MAGFLGCGKAARGVGDCTRPPIRFEFQSYFRVVIIVRGAGVPRRTLVGG